ncbi:MAG TPA: hypothetical protein VFU86_16705 [Terriglobales bacterium]|nr:hypothetical protein [Terriglobales bacterium]
MSNLNPVIAGGAVAILSFSPAVFWTYFLGLVVLVPALIAMLRDRPAQSHGIERVTMFGLLFYAVPMGVFAGDHFVFHNAIAKIVPAWMPWHLFWVYFVGTALLAGGIGLSTRKYSNLAALCFGVMLLCFVLMIHIPNLISAPGNRFALAILLRDLSFGSGALAFAVGQSEGPAIFRSRTLLTVLRCAIAVAAIIFGIEHFMHPNFVPVIPLRRQLPVWIPAHLALSFVTGTILILSGVGLALNRKARAAAAVLGTFTFAIVLLIYVPILIASPAENEALNYVADTLLYSGTVLLLARGLPREERQRSSEERATTIAA